MKKFFKFGKDKKKSGDSQSVGKGSLSSAQGISTGIAGYNVREKDLSKIHKAVWNNEFEKVQVLVKKEVNALDKQHRSALHLAAARGFQEVLGVLLEWKAKVNVGDGESKTPLMKAVEGGHENCVASLLDSHADPNVTDRDGNTALHFASRDGRENLVDILLSEDATEIDGQNKLGQTPLHLALLHNQKGALQALLESSANVNLQDIEGMTVLMHACQKGSIDDVETLLNFKADPHLKENKGWTADDIASMQGFPECQNLVARVRGHRGHVAASGGEALEYDDELEEDAGHYHEITPAGAQGTAKILNQSWESESESETQEQEKVLPRVSDVEQKVEDVSHASRDDQVSGSGMQEVKDKSVEELYSSVTPRDQRESPSRKDQRDSSDKWSDDEDTDSIFSTGDNKKVPLTALRQQVQEEKKAKEAMVLQEVNEDWDDSSSALPSSRNEKSTPLNLVQALQERRTKMDGDEDEADQGAWMKNKSKANGSMTMADTNRVQAMMQDLGLDEVPPDDSDMSEVDVAPVMSFMPSAGSPRGSHKTPVQGSTRALHSAPIQRSSAASVEAKVPTVVISPPVARLQEDEEEDSEWDSTAPVEVKSSKAAGGSSGGRDQAAKDNMQPPVSARSAASNWDSSVLDEDDDEEPDSAAGTKLSPSAGVFSPSTAPSGGLVTPPSAFQSQEALHMIHKDHTLHQQLTSGAGGRQGAQNQPKPLYEDSAGPSQVHQGAPQAGKKDTEDSDWDSGDEPSEGDDNIEAMLRPKGDAAPAATSSGATVTKVTSPRPAYMQYFQQAGVKVAGEEDDDDDDDEDEEEESSWEAERKFKKQLQLSKKKSEQTSGSLHAVNEEEKKLKADEERKTRERQENERKAEEERLEKEREEKEKEEKRLEEERQREEERLEAERLREEEDRKRKEEEARRMQEEKLEEERKEEARKREEEELRRLEEQRKEEDDKKKTKKQKEEEEKRRKEEEKAEKKRLEEEKKMAEKKRKEDEKKAAEKKKKEEEERRQAEKKQKEEEKRRQAEKKKEEAKKPDDKRRMDAEKQDEEEHKNKDNERMEEEEEERSRRWEMELQQKQEQIRIQAQAVLQPEREEVEKLQRQLSEKNGGTAVGAGTLLSPRNTATNDENDDDEHSLQLRQRRLEAEKKLEQAKQKQQKHHSHSKSPRGKAKVHGKMDMSFSDEEDDTFNGIDAPSMDTPYRDYSRTTGGTTAAFTMQQDGVAVTTPAFTQQGSVVIHKVMNDDDEDGLSYSSTEHDLTQAQEVKASTALLNTTPHNNTVFPQQDGNATISVRLQEQVREIQRKLEKEKQARLTAESRKRALEEEREETLRQLEAANLSKSNLEKVRIDLDAKIRSLQYSVTEETERRHNTDVLYEKVQEQLHRKEEQYSNELDQRQKAELTAKNLQTELRTAISNKNQLEEDKVELERRWNQERTARLLQEQINEEQLQFHQSLAADDLQRQLNEALANLESSGEFQKQASENADKLQTEVTALKAELKRSHARSKEEHDLLAVENETMSEKVQELKQQVKNTEDALTQASVQYNLEVSELKTSNSQLKLRLDSEILNSERIEGEMKSLRSRLQSLQLELQREQASRNDLELATKRHQDDFQRAIDNNKHEAEQLRAKNKELADEAASHERKVMRLETDLAVSKATLAERTNQLAMIQQDKSAWLQREGAKLENGVASEYSNLDRSQADRLFSDKMSHDRNQLEKAQDEARFMRGKVEELTARLRELQHERLNLEQRLGEAQELLAQGQESDEVNAMLTSIRQEQETTLHVLETKNNAMTDEVSRLRDELKTSQKQRHEAEKEIKKLQQELSDMNRKLATAETRLEIQEKNREHEDRETSNLRREIERLQVRAQELQDKLLEAQTRAVEKSGTSAAQDAASGDKIKQLEAQTTQLNGQLQLEQQKVKTLEAELQSSSKDALERGESLETEALHQQSQYTSKIHHLHQENVELKSNVDEEKGRVYNAMEIRGMIESQLTEEQEKNREMQKQVESLKMHLKAAKKKIQNLGESDTRPLSATYGAGPPIVYGENKLQQELDQTRKELLDELNRLRSYQQTMLHDKESSERETHRLRQMYEDEVQMRQRLMSRLDLLDHPTTPASLLDRQRLTVSQPYVGSHNHKSATSLKLEELSQKLQHQLNRSIARHLEKGPQVDISIPRRPLDDGLTTTTYEDYMKTLQRNYLI